MKDSTRQYPAQTGSYAVKVKNGRGWDAFDTARLQISVGQEYHEGEKFRATVEWAKHRFDKVIICVNDTLQRFNDRYQTMLEEADAFARTREEGAAWIARNRAVIETLPSYELYRWDDWRGHAGFEAEHAHILDLYLRDGVFRDHILAEVMRFWKRRTEKAAGGMGCSFEAFKLASIEYLLEETAAFFLMFKKDMAVDIYPGSTLLPCLLAQAYCDVPARAQLGERAFTRIDFSRKAANDA